MFAKRIFTIAIGVWACAAVVVGGQPPQGPPAPSAPAFTDYIIGPQDVLTINSFDQADLSGRFTVEADGTFTYPLIGRLKAGGLTLRQIETELKKRLEDDKFFVNPQLSVAVEQFKSQKVFIVGE